MKKNLRIWISLVFFVAATIWCGINIIIRNAKNGNFEYGFQTMDTWCTVSLMGDKESCRRGVKIAEEAFREVERVANIFAENSELALINKNTRAGDIFEPSAVLLELFSLSGCGSQATGGKFDPTILPLLEVYRQKSFSQDDIKKAESLVGFNEAVAINDNKLLILKSGVKFDFGGIAKGYAVDRAMAACSQATGIKGGIINAGGNIGIFGDMGSVEVAFADPDAPESDGGTFDLASGMACASSGDYRRGKHIIDPATGKAACAVHGVTVIAPSGAEADLWSTALFADPTLELPENIYAIIPDGQGGFYLRTGSGEQAQ